MGLRGEKFVNLGTKAQRGVEAAADFDDLPLTVIEKRSGWRFFDLRELWRYRELLYFLVWRDLKVRYKQTALGVLWAVLQPTAIMITFSIFFHRLAELGSGGLAYPLYVFAGVIPWIFLANAITAAGQSIVGNQDLVTKLYFPRVIIPMSAVAAALVDFAVAFGVLLILIPCYGWPLTWALLWVPAVVFLLTVTALGAGMLLAALTVAYRDFRHVVPFLVQLWMFATPTIYMKENLHLNPRWSVVLPFNPADGLITTFRSVALGTEFDSNSAYGLLVSGAVGLVLFAVGCLYFRRVERSFADII
jgi:lipopolysaccharide transport system permease protein